MNATAARRPQPQPQPSLPQLPRRHRLGSLIASVLVSTVLLSSVVVRKMTSAPEAQRARSPPRSAATAHACDSVARSGRPLGVARQRGALERDADDLRFAHHPLHLLPAQRVVRGAGSVHQRPHLLLELRINQTRMDFHLRACRQRMPGDRRSARRIATAGVVQRGSEQRPVRGAAVPQQVEGFARPGERIVAGLAAQRQRDRQKRARERAAIGRFDAIEALYDLARRDDRLVDLAGVEQHVSQIVTCAK